MFRISAILLFGVLCAANLFAASDDFERILFPLVVTGHPGAYGTMWTTGAVVRNEGATAVEMFTSECYFRCAGQCVITMCQPGQPTPAGSAFPGGLDRGEIGAIPNPATLLYVERAKAGSVAASLRLFETTRRTVEFGVEIPVVRERELVTTMLSLPAVPIPEPHEGRTHLRLYGVESPSGTARLRVRVFAGDVLTLDRVVDLLPPAFSGATPLPGVYDEPQPSYLLMLLPPELAAGSDAVRLTVESSTSGLKFWAMASVTSNETQHVTTVSPN